MNCLLKRSIYFLTVCFICSSLLLNISCVHSKPKKFQSKIQTMSDNDLLRPGEKARKSGQYEITGPRGGGTGIERTVTKGEPMPPSLEPGQRYRLVDPTKHGRKPR